MTWREWGGVMPAFAKALAARGADVRALVRRGLSVEERSRIEASGVTPVPADAANIDDMARAVVGAVCVVSALNGLRDVMIGRQDVLLDAAVKAGVPRFIPSDFAADFTMSPPSPPRRRSIPTRRASCGSRGTASARAASRGR